MTADRHLSPLRRFVRLAVAWLIAIVIPLQAVSAVVAVAAGPLHTHVRSEPIVVLVDLRRSFAAPTRAMPEPVSEWQHAVSHALPQRHVHAPSDGTVVDIDDPLASTQPNKADIQAGLLIGMVPSIAAWFGSVAPTDLEPLAMWSPTTAHPRLPERPPRAA